MTIHNDTEASLSSVSIVVTTFNRVNLLSETIGSILGQTYTDFELIIVDNMSEDGTKEYVVGIADSRIRYYKNANNGVIAVNRNFGIQQSMGKYIALCDDDDLWLSDKLQCQVDLMESKPGVALCYTNAESFSDDKILKRKMIRRSVRSNHFNQLLRGNYILNSSVLIRTQVFSRLGLLTADSMLREDYHMWLRIVKDYTLKGIDESLVRYRVHLSNVIGNRTSETLRAIRTVKSIVKLVEIPWLFTQVNIGFQYLKYILYFIVK